MQLWTKNVPCYCYQFCFIITSSSDTRALANTLRFYAKFTTYRPNQQYSVKINNNKIKGNSLQQKCTTVAVCNTENGDQFARAHPGSWMPKDYVNRANEHKELILFSCFFFSLSLSLFQHFVSFWTRPNHKHSFTRKTTPTLQNVP